MLASMNCVVCGQRPAEVGLLCEDCRDELSGPLYISPEQIASTASKPTGAVLVDLWGRPHALDPRTLIGRHLDGVGVSLLESSISRHHAHLALDPARHQWTLRDLGSANGTFVNEQPVKDAITVRQGDRIGIGALGFYFLERAEGLPRVELSPTAGATIRPGERIRAVPPPPGATTTTQPQLPVVDDDEGDFEEKEERTDVGLPSVSIRMHEPTGGGGGVVEVETKQVQLTTTQFEFFRLLCQRMVEESHQPELVRGFVRSSELVGNLSWDTREPGDNHVKQLVRRVRRALLKADIGDLIESRHRFGYRLRAIPILS
jgi:hypothetical protein